MAYRDHGDEYVTRATQLTTDIDGFYQALHALRPIGGGDRPEAVADALREATRALAWSDGPDVRRLVIVLGDAPPHARSPGLSEATEARQRGLSVSTILVGEDPDAASAFAALAAAGDGSALRVRPLAQGRLAEQVTTPLDAQIAAVQRRIEETVIAHGTREERGRLEAQKQLNGSLGLEEYASRASAMSKTRGSYAGDLLNALESGRLKRADVDAWLLPGAFVRDGEPDWARIDALLAQRAAARAELAALVKQRDAWLAANVRASGLDAQLLDCIGRHAAR